MDIKATIKESLKSRTLWINAVIAIAAFFPAAKAVVTPDVLLQITVVVNFVMRLITKKPLLK